MLMSSRTQPARLLYEPNGFRVLRTGRYVLCAVSEAEIPLEDLRYWSVEHQEAYATAEIATRHLTGQR